MLGNHRQYSFHCLPRLIAEEGGPEPRERQQDDGEQHEGNHGLPSPKHRHRHTTSRGTVAVSPTPGRRCSATRDKLERLPLAMAHPGRVVSHDFDLTLLRLDDLARQLLELLVPGPVVGQLRHRYRPVVMSDHHLGEIRIDVA